MWVTPQTLLAAIVGTKIAQHQSGIGCHNNFVKTKDAFSRVQGQFCNMIRVFEFSRRLAQVTAYFKHLRQVHFVFQKVIVIFEETNAK